MAKLGLEARMTIKELSRRKVSNCEIARTLEVTEGTVRYHLRRQAEGATDGRANQTQLAAGWRDPIDHWLECRYDDEPINFAVLHEYLREEHSYPGSLRSLQRYMGRQFPKPRRRARRRVETPPGAQGQVDWAGFREILIANELWDLLAFEMKLSHARKRAVVWSPGKDQLCWHHAHNEGFRRIGGVPATLRVDNEKTAVSRGAGAWGEINAAYRRYAETVRFHVDACPPRAPEAKGKVERAIRDHRYWADPRGRHWNSLEELQAWTDERIDQMDRRSICPATGTTVYEAWQEEKRHLAPVPLLPEPFDVVVTRRVAHDCMVAFEARSYSVPFRLIGRQVEVRGCAGTVQMLHGTELVASHPRHTRERILIDSRHFEGESTDEVIAPTPLGRMGRRLAEIAAMEPQRRPMDLYAALAEVAR